MKIFRFNFINMQKGNAIASRGIVFNSQNEILLVSPDNLIWELPGGGVDNHDLSSEEQAVLEVYEETGLNCKADHFTGIFEFSIKKDEIIYRTVVFYYKCSLTGNEILDPNWKDLCCETIKYRKFFNFDEFKNILKNINGRKSLKIFQQFNSFEEIKDIKSKHFGFANYVDNV